MSALQLDFHVIYNRKPLVIYNRNPLTFKGRRLPGLECGHVVLEEQSQLLTHVSRNDAFNFFKITAECRM